MRKAAMIFSILAAGAMFAGCADNHIMHMKDGSIRVVEGKPQLDKATGLVIYVDESGRQQAVNQDEIKDMRSL